jgi:1-acyl-sn-glycerol-3-phosphate acyltransferase
MNIFFWVVRTLLKGYFHLFYRFKIEGTRNYYKGSAIIAPNHTSFYDPPIIGIGWPEETHFLARSSLFKTSFGNWLLKHLNSHPVEGSAQNIQTFKIICKLLGEGKKVVIFPEGERSQDGNLTPIKSGIAMLALRMKCPVIPAYIDGAYEVWPRTRRYPNMAGRMTCIFGEPIFVEPYLTMDKKTAQEELSKKIEAELKELKASLEK